MSRSAKTSRRRRRCGRGAATAPRSSPASTGISVTRKGAHASSSASRRSTRLGGRVSLVSDELCASFPRACRAFHWFVARVLRRQALESQADGAPFACRSARRLDLHPDVSSWTDAIAQYEPPPSRHRLCCLRWPACPSMRQAIVRARSGDARSGDARSDDAARDRAMHGLAMQSAQGCDTMYRKLSMCIRGLHMSDSVVDNVAWCGSNVFYTSCWASRVWGSRRRALRAPQDQSVSAHR